jgi:translation initiation factor IF-1
MIKGEFTLTENESEYPAKENQEVIDMMGFNAIQVRGTTDDVSIRIHIKGKMKSSHIIPEVMPGKIYETLPFPLEDNSGYIVFTADPNESKIFVAKLQYELLNVNSDEYNKLSSRNWHRQID